MFIEYRGKRPKVASSAFIAPTAVLIGDVEIGEESSVWFGAVLRGDNGPIRVGARSSIQDNSVLHVSEGCETVVGNDVTVGHSVTMEDCRVEDWALIGSNAVILNYAKIGRRALIAAGSVVPTGADIPPEVVAAGAPAKVKKALDGTSVQWVDHGGPEYVQLSRAYLREGIHRPV